MALAWVALAQGQASKPASTPAESRVGKVITVTEANRAPEKCMVLQAWRLSDGGSAMQAKSVESGEMMSIVEAVQPAASGERFRVYRWGPTGVPPQGTPVPPGMKTAVASSAPKTVVANSVRQVGGKVATAPMPEQIVQAPYLKPADAGQAVVHAAATTPASQPLPSAPVTKTTETKVHSGPYIVGQPNVPVVLANRPLPNGEAAAQPQPAAPAPPAPAPAAPAPATDKTAIAKPATPAAAPVVDSGCGVPGKIILVSEPNCPPQQCQVLSVSGSLHGKTMQVKNLCTGECFTIVERCNVSSFLDRFCLFRGHSKQPCPVACAPCDGTAPVNAGPSKPGEQLPMPKDAVKPTTGMTGPSKYATGLLPPGEAPVLNEKPVENEKQVIATSQPERIVLPSRPAPSLAQTTIAATPAKPAKESTWRKLWGRPQEEPVAKKPEMLPKPELVKDAAEPEKPVAKVAKVAQPSRPELPPVMRPEEKKNDVKPVESVKKTELVSGPVMAKPTAAVEMPAKPNDLPVPVPLVPLATTEPRPNAPPPQPPINPYSTMQSVSMVKYAPQDTLPPMCPTCHRALPGAGTASGNGVQQANACLTCQPNMPVAAGPVSPSLWTRGPAVPVSQSPVMVSARRLMTETEAQAMQNTVHLMTVLQSSGVPAQREWAATRLRVCDPQMHPYVVESLVTTAKTDGAAMVRAAAIQSLAQMKANAPHVVTMIEHATQDRDPRVRDEAIQAVKLLTGQDTTSVQPAVHSVEKK
jgi:hypothetical protein